MIEPLASASRVAMIGLSSRSVSAVDMSIQARWKIRPPADGGARGRERRHLTASADRQLQVRVDPGRLHAQGVSLDNAQFQISVVHDPYGCALVADPNTGKMVASVYRRPLPTANLSFLSTVMWDGRETLSLLNTAPRSLQTCRATSRIR